MKILFTVSTYYPKKDGVQSVTQYLAEGLVKKGNNVTVITTSKGEHNDSEIHNGVKIIRVNLYTKYGMYFGDKKNYINLIKKLSKDCDVMINVCTQNAFTDVILKHLDKFDCKKVLYLHGIFDFKFNKIHFSSFSSFANKIWKEFRWFFYYLLNGKYFKKYDVVTQLHQKDYSTSFFKKHYNIDSVIIENAAGIEFFNNKVEKDFVKPFDKYLIFVANYDDRKNQKKAIEQFLKSDIDKSVGLVLIGSSDNAYYKMLEKYICSEKKRLNLRENDKPIKLLHHIDRRLISSYVSNAYLYIMTSKWEAFPISIVESMACGVPYICTDVGIVKYFIGGIVSAPDEFCYWIETLFNDESIRDSLSKICKDYANDNFKIEDKVERLLNSIKRIGE